MEELNTNTQGQENTTEVTTGTEENKTYTQAEVDELLQKESDRRVSAALKKAEQKKANAIREAQKVAAMDEQQKYVYQLEQREAEVAEKERQLALAEMKNTTSKILSEKGISLSLVDLVVNEDADITTANIKTLEKAFKESVKKEVEARLASKSPTKSLPMDNVITKEQFKKMGARELTELKQNQPELWAELTK